jgi:hypothetical protein
MRHEFLSLDNAMKTTSWLYEKESLGFSSGENIKTLGKSDKDKKKRIFDSIYEKDDLSNLGGIRS